MTKVIIILNVKNSFKVVKRHIVDELKRQFPKILQESLGIVTDACKRVGMSREWYYNHYEADPEFKKACDDVKETVIDFVEGHLYQQIADNVPASTIFYLKTKAKNRGYVERIEQSGPDGKPIEHAHSISNVTKEQIDAIVRIGSEIDESA
jgi:hypothetical protein